MSSPCSLRSSPPCSSPSPHSHLLVVGPKTPRGKKDLKTPVRSSMLEDRQVTDCKEGMASPLFTTPPDCPIEDTTCPLDHLMTPKAQQMVCQSVSSPYNSPRRPYSSPHSSPYSPYNSPCSPYISPYSSPYSCPMSPPDNTRGLGLNLTLEQDKQLPVYKRILAALVECFCG